MGLDITAYSNLTPIGVHTEGWCQAENHVTAFAYEGFEASFRGLPILEVRDMGSASFIWGGCYAITASTETHGFRAGSYGGYNEWRRGLQEQFNLPRRPDGPFYELIWFADNEGSIGPEAAADLLVDFRAHAASAFPEDDWARAKYADWVKAFELASTGGLVSFH